MVAVLMIAALLLGVGSSAFAAPIVSQSSETQNQQAAVASPDADQNQADGESLVVGQMSSEAMWILLGVVIVIGIVIVAA